VLAICVGVEVMAVSVLGVVKPSPPATSFDELRPLTYWAFRPETRVELLTLSGATFAGAFSLSGVLLLLFRYGVVVSWFVCPRMKFPPLAALATPVPPRTRAAVSPNAASGLSDPTACRQCRPPSARPSLIA
jgi:hypothetical protein